MSSTDPSIPPVDGSCYLLGLPRELRDEVYEYALTSDEDFLYDDQLDGFNQLQYVSKQLRAETLGLTLKLNKQVHITCDKDILRMKPCDIDVYLDQRLSFLTTCTTVSTSKLATIQIDLQSGYSQISNKCTQWDSITGPLRRWCSTHIHVMVKLRSEAWKLTYGKSVTRFILEGKYAKHHCFRLRFPNLRVLPTGKFDEGVLAQRLLAERDYLGIFDTAGIERWLPRVRTWFSEGMSEVEMAWCPGLEQLPSIL
ncbi:hypothetical protein BU16DRAFT_561481 [Lophium mytilinum]|uniref:F-box domain-containing protein n=1 Tax=Lophium mytilinum TaxID=390894 RepID=A0A6A6QS27_9PEZI|nr:hypothetical protein BU16DRAFT_561481 [Lophium mytilinum]